MHRANHQDQILNADVKICLLEVVLPIALGRLVKRATALILVVLVLHQWIAINLACVLEFLNQIFQKMLLVKS
jgi:hypothetical protein